MSQEKDHRSLGMLGATSIGVGAIVGGGILALAGVGLEAAGPAAIAAFALNGLIAVLTALSFAELAAAFPESGGTYTFAKKVYSIQTAFIIGWVVWFASIAAGALYALGFAAYAVIAVEHIWQALGGTPPAWLGRPTTSRLLALGATGLYALSLMRRSNSGGQWMNAGKVLVFAVLIVGGLWALSNAPADTGARLQPFFAGGGLGLLQAMGYTFIALQGFDLIAAVGGEVRRPSRIIPRAMLLSLAIALIIYIPLLFVIVLVGVPADQSIREFSARYAETVVAAAAQRYLGTVGFWLVVVAALLSMLSALYANILAASRVALAMGRDRSLPYRFERLHPQRGTPAVAVQASAFVLAAVLLLLPDVAAAGAAASLIFLISFALAHLTSLLARRRLGGRVPFRVPFFPLVPLVGGVSCIALALFQGIAVPAAGLITAGWMGLGATLYWVFFRRRARVVDASAEAVDPQLVRLRGRSPLVLVPIANPANAGAMVTVANALVTPQVGRVLLLTVVETPDIEETAPQPLVEAQKVLGESLLASFAAGLAPEALTTVAPQAWAEISRVARSYGCESLVLGLSRFEEGVAGNQLEDLVGSLLCDVVLLRASEGWNLDKVERVLVPIGGHGEHDELRARLLGSLHRTGTREITFLRVVPHGVSEGEYQKAQRQMRRIARDKVPGRTVVEVVRNDDMVGEVIQRAQHSQLIVLGLERRRKGRRVFGPVALSVASQTDCAILMVSRGS